jgi:hypothetical protein
MENETFIEATIGPNFDNEIIAAGLMGLKFSWNASGVLVSNDVSPEDLEKLKALIVAHDATKVPVVHAAECTPAQGEIALYQTGHYEAYQAAVASSSYVPLKIYVSKATKWEIANPYIQAMQAELGLSDDEVQALFDLAVSL